jgi:phenylalanine ammonia-lyase
LSNLFASRNGKSVKVDGHTLSIAAVTAAARYNAVVDLDQSPLTKEQVAKSRAVIASKVESGASVYGLSTGFGGSGKQEANVMSPRS